MIERIFQDWKVNTGNPKGRFVLLFFRLCQLIRQSRLWWLGSPILLSYVVAIEWIMGIELGYGTKVGRRLRLYHGAGLVVHPDASIGDDCILRHGVTIGDRGPDSPVPVIGNSVEFGCGATVLGGVRVGDGARIGACAVVLQDVPAGAVTVGNPGRILPPKVA